MDQHGRRKGKVPRSQFGTAARKKSFMLQMIFVFVEAPRSTPSASLSSRRVSASNGVWQVSRGSCLIFIASTRGRWRRRRVRSFDI
jgi:hypothetical protein